MVDLCDRGTECDDEMEKRSESTPRSRSHQEEEENQERREIEEENGETKRTCVDCGRTKTPVWRGGPSGPKTVCNACGIKNGKRRRALLGLSNTNVKNKKKKKKKLIELGRKVLTENSNKLGEEEEAAALLLMAMSNDA